MQLHLVKPWLHLGVSVVVCCGASAESVAAPTATALRRDMSVNFQPGQTEEGAAAPSVPPSAPASALPSPARGPAASLGTAGVPASPEPGQGQSTDDEGAEGVEGGVLDIWKHDEEEKAATVGGLETGQASRLL